MNKRRDPHGGGSVAAVLTATLVAMATSAYAASTPEQKCEAGMNDSAGRYAACLGKAEKAFVTTGDVMKYSEALAQCASKLAATWGKLEQKAVDAGATCPSSADQAAIQDFADACAQGVAVAVGGGTLPLDVIDCNAGLGTCTTDLSSTNADLGACTAKLGVMKTGQTTAFGPGSDGDLELGVPRSFTDNGDGTVTDNVTGLMWEKKSDDGSVHDKDNTYTWGMDTSPFTMDGTMVSTFLADLNAGGGFAGHTDWRLPNLLELQSLLNFRHSSPDPTVYLAFNDACTGGCTVATCSCTEANVYWTSTTTASSSSQAWFVSFYSGSTSSMSKSVDLPVRAVRAGF